MKISFKFQTDLRKLDIFLFFAIARLIIIINRTDKGALKY